MFLLKVQYDGYNKQFKLVESQEGHMLDDGEIYTLIADATTEDPGLAGTDPV